MGRPGTGKPVVVGRVIGLIQGLAIRVRGIDVLIDPEDEHLVCSKSWTMPEKYKSFYCGFMLGKKHCAMTMARYIFYKHGLLKENTMVCHKNNNPLDCRKCNLINLTRKQRQYIPRRMTYGGRKNTIMDVPQNVCREYFGWKVSYRLNDKKRISRSFKTLVEAREMAQKLWEEDLAMLSDEDKAVLMPVLEEEFGPPHETAPAFLAPTPLIEG